MVRTFALFLPGNDEAQSVLSNPLLMCLVTSVAGVGSDIIFLWFTQGYPSAGGIEMSV